MNCLPFHRKGHLAPLLRRREDGFGVPPGPGVIPVVVGLQARFQAPTLPLSGIALPGAALFIGAQPPPPV